MIKETRKQYYAIGDVSAMTGLDQHVLRYWETEFAELRPRKNRAGRRLYTDEDVAVVLRIQHLLKEDKYTIEGAKQVLARGPAGRQAAHVAAGPAGASILQLRAFLVDLMNRLPDGDAAPPAEPEETADQG